MLPATKGYSCVARTIRGYIPQQSNSLEKEREKEREGERRRRKKEEEKEKEKERRKGLGSKVSLGLYHSAVGW